MKNWPNNMVVALNNLGNIVMKPLNLGSISRNVTQVYGLLTTKASSIESGRKSSLTSA